MKAHIEALRCIAYLNAEGIDLARLHPDEAERALAQEQVDILTPITKGWSTEIGVELTSLAVQVHGGMGYIEETGVAQHYRDVRIAPIYEGTNGIQAMDLVGRKLGLRGGAAFVAFVDAMATTADEARAAGGALAVIGDALHVGIDTLRAATSWLQANAPADPNNAFAGATPFLRLAGITTEAWLLTRSALAAVGSAGRRRRRLQQRVPRSEARHGAVLRHPDPAPGHRPAPGGDRRPRRPLRRRPLTAGRRRRSASRLPGQGVDSS